MLTALAYSDKGLYVYDWYLNKDGDYTSDGYADRLSVY